MCRESGEMGGLSGGKDRLGLGFASGEGTCAAIGMGGWCRGGLFVSLGFCLGLGGDWACD